MVLSWIENMRRPRGDEQQDQSSEAVPLVGRKIAARIPVDAPEDVGVVAGGLAASVQPPSPVSPSPAQTEPATPLVGRRLVNTHLDPSPVAPVSADGSGDVSGDAATMPARKVGFQVPLPQVAPVRGPYGASDPLSAASRSASVPLPVSTPRSDLAPPAGQRFAPVSIDVLRKPSVAPRVVAAPSAPPASVQIPDREEVLRQKKLREESNSPLHSGEDAPASSPSKGDEVTALAGAMRAAADTAAAKKSVKDMSVDMAASLPDAQQNTHSKPDLFSFVPNESADSAVAARKEGDTKSVETKDALPSPDSKVDAVTSETPEHPEENAKKQESAEVKSPATDHKEADVAPSPVSGKKKAKTKGASKQEAPDGAALSVKIVTGQVDAETTVSPSSSAVVPVKGTEKGKGEDKTQQLPMPATPSSLPPQTGASAELSRAQALVSVIKGVGAPLQTAVSEVATGLRAQGKEVSSGDEAKAFGQLIQQVVSMSRVISSMLEIPFRETASGQNGPLRWGVIEAVSDIVGAHYRAIGQLQPSGVVGHIITALTKLAVDGANREDLIPGLGRATQARLGITLLRAMPPVVHSVARYSFGRAPLSLITEVAWEMQCKSVESTRRLLMHGATLDDWHAVYGACMTAAGQLYAEAHFGEADRLNAMEEYERDKLKVRESPELPMQAVWEAMDHKLEVLTKFSLYMASSIPNSPLPPPSGGQGMQMPRLGASTPALPAGTSPTLAQNSLNKNILKTGATSYRGEEKKNASENVSG